MTSPYLLFIFCFCIFCTQSAMAQDTLLLSKESEKNIVSKQDKKEAGYVIINQIEIIGNEKTKNNIILRELDVAEGDTVFLANVDSILLRNKNKIFNTNLFVTVELSIEKNKDQESTILKIKLLERWYFFPFPIFELSDRNFNEWITTYKADLSRTNYGIRLVKENFRGRNEKLDFLAQFGFTQRFSLVYNIPYLDRRQKHGLSIGVVYSQNKSAPYQTTDHKLTFVKSDNIILERFDARLTFTKRNAFYSFHNVEIRFKNNYVADTILLLNPNFFGNNRKKQTYLAISYGFRRDVRDIQAYPLKGNLFQIQIDKQGLFGLDDLDIWRGSAIYAKYTSFGKKWYMENYLRTQFILNDKQQPYFDAKALGYNDAVMRGFELDVIDGQGFFINKNTIKYQLLNRKSQVKFIPIRQFRTIPFALYLTSYLDFGYVRDQLFTETSSRLNNKVIYSYGLGIDTVTYYNLVISFNYSFNSAGRNGLFLGVKTNL